MAKRKKRDTRDAEESSAPADEYPVEDIQESQEVETLETVPLDTQEDTSPVDDAIEQRQAPSVQERPQDHPQEHSQDSGACFLINRNNHPVSLYFLNNDSVVLSPKQRACFPSSIVERSSLPDGVSCLI